MKHILITIILLLNATYLLAQENKKSTSVSIGLKSGGGDTTILDSNITQFQIDDVIITIKRDSSYKEKKDTVKSIKSHWAGIDLGINGLLNSSGSADLSNPSNTSANEVTNFMELDYRHSWMFSLNLFEKNFRTKNETFGILTGLGFEWNNYELKNNVRLIHNGGHFVNPNVTPYTDKYTWGSVDSTATFSKNRFKTVSVNVPLLVDLTLGKKKDFFIAFGPVLGFNFRSKMKYKTSDGKEKNKQDFNVNPFSLDLTARIGYKSFTAYANYSATTLFEKYKGPELYPFSVGIALMSF